MEQFDIIKSKYDIVEWGLDSSKNRCITIACGKYIALLKQSGDETEVFFPQINNRKYNKKLHNFVAAAHYCNNILSAEIANDNFIRKLDKLIARQYR